MKVIVAILRERVIGDTLMLLSNLNYDLRMGSLRGKWMNRLFCAVLVPLLASACGYIRPASLDSALTATVYDSSNSWLSLEAPELHAILMRINSGYAGKVESTDSANIALIKARGNIFNLVAAQPEAADALFASQSFFGVPSVSTPNTKASYLFFLKYAYRSIALQPEIIDTITAHIPTIYSSAPSTEIEQIARMAGLAEIFDAIARQPEMSDALADVAKNNTGGLSKLDSELVVAARNYAIGKLMAAIARQPEAAADLVSKAEQLLGRFDQIDASYIHGGEDYLLTQLSTAISVQPEAATTLTDALTQLTGLVAH